MASQAPPFGVGGQGTDPQELREDMARVLSYIHRALPDPPVSAVARLTALPEPRGLAGVDRVSRLPDALLGNIVSRLPVKDAARTAVLSRRWRPVWRSAPLALSDTHLLPAGGDEIPSHLDGADSRAVAAAVSRVVAAHPGPFRSVRLACCYMNEHRDWVVRWLQHLAVKGVEELFLINRPLPFALDKHMPATLFSMAALTRLYLGYFRFPDTAALPRGAAFPCLRELGLCGVVIDTRDIDFVLARSPVLDILCFEGHVFPLRLRLVSRSLRCVQIHGSHLESVTLVDTPRLERLLIPMNLAPEGLSTKIKIGNAPALRVFGSFEPERDVLQVGSTTIKAGTVMNTSAMVSAVKFLDIKLRFGVRNDAKILPSFLRCFPNVETLHIHSKRTTETTGRLNLKFWQESGVIECVKSHISVMAFYDFRGERSELAFLKFFIESAQVMKRLMIVCAKGCFSSMDEVNSKVKTLFAGKRATGRCALLICESSLSQGGGLWDFQRGSDFSCRDPFDCIRCSPFGVSQCSV
ncbi:hypothetical protein ACP70R_009317 [Stipagrostis hirtigluma subsp. patula]